MVTHHSPNVVWLTSVVFLFAAIVAFIFLLPSPKDFTPPTVDIFYSDKGAVFRGMVDIGVYAEDSSGIERVEISLDCTLPIASFTRPPYTFVWDTTPLAVKRYTLCVTAWDNAGLSSSVTREVSVVR